jgi:hypothetical protein
MGSEEFSQLHFGMVLEFLSFAWDDTPFVFLGGVDGVFFFVCRGGGGKSRVSSAPIPTPCPQRLETPRRRAIHTFRSTVVREARFRLQIELFPPTLPSFQLRVCNAFERKREGEGEISDLLVVPSRLRERGDGSCWYRF